MNVGAIGYNQTHEADFVMDRPDGSGCELFLHIRTPAVFELNGVKYKVRKGSIVLISPDTSFRYFGDGVNYCDDWIYYDITTEEKNRLIRDGVIFDRPIYLRSTDELGSIIHKITYEHYSADIYSKEMAKRYFEILFVKLIRLIKAGGDCPPGILSEKSTALSYLRSRIYADPCAFGSIEYMANYVNMSVSGLQHSYKKLFGVNISNDVIASRIERAKTLLSSTNLTIDKIADSSGYGCTYSFLRQFKERCGCTPTQYRKKALPDDELWGKIISESSESSESEED